MTSNAKPNEYRANHTPDHAICNVIDRVASCICGWLSARQATTQAARTAGANHVATIGRPRPAERHGERGLRAIRAYTGATDAELVEAINAGQLYTEGPRANPYVPHVALDAWLLRRFLRRRATGDTAA